MPRELLEPIIRNATISDVAILTRIIREASKDVAARFNLTEKNCPKHPSNCREQWVIDALEKGVRHYLLESEGEPCGCVALEQANSEICYLERLAVLPAHRRRGHGRALVEHVLREARTLGVKKVDIGIIAGHSELGQWYRNIGFEEVRTAAFDHLPFEVLFMSMEVYE
jgi:N-acetylglutamate synthase-like GNAT family acetyltransferase